MKTPYFYLLIFTLSSLLHLQAQNRNYRQYATQEVMARLEKENPNILSAKSEIERFLAKDRFKYQAKQQVIPVAFHILYNPGAEYPTAEEVLAQLNGLNRDFGEADPVIKSERYGFTAGGFDKKLAKAQISFCLAEPPKDFKKESSINFVPVTRKSWGLGDSLKAERTGGVSPWTPETILNIWVVKLSDDKAGYAQMPGGPLASDGVVIDYKYFGVNGKLSDGNYAEGKTLTHLVGTYLGLYELWDERIPCSDDYVDDTPIHNAPNFGVNNYQQISMCDRQTVEMTMNFMDNSDDEQLVMFTNGQKARMQAILSKEGPRAKLADGDTKCSKPKLSDPLAEAEDILALKSTETEQQTVKVFPNPVRNLLSIEISSKLGQGQYRTVLYDELGRIVYQNQGPHEGFRLLQVDCAKYPAGIYFLHVTVDDKRFNDKLIIIQQ
jgi:Secretion system C-terminal sorting domain/Pregnancy-associated plasma protein-A